MGKNRKFVLAFLLVLVMVVATACSDSGEVKQPANVNGDSSVISGNEATGQDSENEVDDTAGIEVKVAETVLYDANDIKVTATGFEDGWMGPEIKILVENNSSKNVLVTTEAVSVNGYMMPFASLYAEVAAGKKANDSLSIMSSELERSGVATVAEVQFYINISDADTWDDIATSELLTLNTSAAGLEQPANDSEDVIYDSNGIKVVCKGLKQDIIWDGTIVFYMENNSGEPITVHAENVSVNGFMEDAGLWSDLRDGTKIVDGMSLLDLSDLELESIDEVKNIEFNLRIINSETWDEIVTTDVITLDFE